MICISHVSSETNVDVSLQVRVDLRHNFTDMMICVQLCDFRARFHFQLRTK